MINSANFHFFCIKQSAYDTAEPCTDFRPKTSAVSARYGAGKMVRIGDRRDRRADGEREPP